MPYKITSSIGLTSHGSLAKDLPWKRTPPPMELNTLVRGREELSLSSETQPGCTTLP